MTGGGKAACEPPRASVTAVVAHLGEHPEAEVLTSLPRSGRINAAQMLAEWGDRREAYPEPDSVAMLGGQDRQPHNPALHGAVTQLGAA